MKKISLGRAVIFSLSLLFIENGCAAPKSLSQNRDYQSVTIGTQQWLAKNMAVKSRESYAPNGLEQNIEKYGRLYTWPAAQKVCPRGWRLPTKDDFFLLLQTVCGNAEGRGCGDKFKSQLRAPLAGGFYLGDYFSFDYRGHWWTASSRGQLDACYLQLDGADLTIETDSQDYAFSVWCIKAAP